MDRQSLGQPERLLTIDQVADWLAVSKRTVLRMIASQELVAVSVGRCRRVPESEYVAYMERLIRRSRG
jgi:excisionase family DNA binding protein